MSCCREWASSSTKLVRIEAKVISHVWRTVFQLAEAAVSEALFKRYWPASVDLRYAPG